MEGGSIEESIHEIEVEMHLAMGRPINAYQRSLL